MFRRVRFGSRPAAAEVLDAVDVIARLKDESEVPHGSLSMNRSLLTAALPAGEAVTLRSR